MNRINTRDKSSDGVIQLISSAQHYAFNLKWLETPAPSEPVSCQ